MRRLLSLAPLLFLLRPALAAPERPNVLLILTDDQTLESMRVMDRTLARLAADGTTFSNSIVSYPMCCPSRASELTGQYAHNHKVMGNNPPDGGYGRLDGSNTLPVWLRQAGYETAHVGKYLNGYTGPEVPPGWTHWFGLADPSTYRVYDYTVIDDGKPVHHGEDEDDYQTDVLARKADELLRGMIRSGKPFFLSVAPVPPHLVEGLSRNPAKPSYEAIRTARWLYVEYHTGARELYDLQADPLQLVSRHDAPALRAVRADLARRLAKLRKCAGKSCR